ncbi:SMP-30/gluconolactonase/LRE family protein [Catellatospora sichuanensis]|uniref:SMP-30/gluconolactonase/LRE family protein n=1 Tax=Catellatospora sichuanensis TaxID=1969805 RepID=UPI0011842B24|nr:SMP-30/gluconolactonase/LRE family protein [Catellatospora sichuanensis]
MKPRIRPIVWQPPATPARARQPHGAVPMPQPVLHPLPGIGPEDVAAAPDGAIYTGLADGRILRVRDDIVEVVADTGGRPLGIEVGAEGALVVCDAVRGLLSVRPTDGAIEDLVPAGTPIDGVPLRVCNNAAIAADGAIWFSDSSARFDLAHWKADLIEHSGSGRLLRRDPDGTVTTVLTGLHFANGVALAADESFVAVAETGAYRLTRWWLTGPQTGRSDVLVDNLPGFPDNIARGSDGLIWIAMGSPRNRALDLLAPRPPVLRRMLWALPEALLPQPADTVWVQAVDTAGRTVHDLQTATPGFSMVTGVREESGTVWLGSLHSAAIAHFTLP